MGVQVGIDGTQLGLFRSARARCFVALASRWYDERRDGSEVYPGVYQPEQVHASSVSALHADAPADLAQFRDYCALHGYETHLLHDDDLRAVRDFIASAALNGGNVWYSW